MIAKQISYTDIRTNEEINTLIERGNDVMKVLGFTEHSRKHAAKVADCAGDILTQLGYDSHQVELAKIAGYMHDIGNSVNRNDHAHTGFGNAVYSAALEIFIECTVLAVKLCLPILAAELIGQLGMGILMKMIPQINVFSINIELKVIIGLLMLWMLIMPFSEFLLEVENNMLHTISQILAMAG